MPPRLERSHSGTPHSHAGCKLLWLRVHWLQVKSAVWLAIDSHQPTNVATAIAQSIAATETVSKAQIFEYLETQFARADSNHDGELDADELAVFRHAVARQEASRR